MLSPEATRWLAIGVVATLALSLVAFVYRDFRRRNFTPVEYPIYIYTYVMGFIRWRAEIVGRIPFGPGQGAIVVCNHIGQVDPAFVALASPRRVHWMVAREFVVSGLFSKFLQVLQVIPVGRGGIDTAATRAAVRYAQSGELVGLFPEGRINESDRLLLPGRPGAALIALKARVPVLPCYLEGNPYPFDGSLTGFIHLPGKVRLVIGEPMDLSEYYDRVRDKEVLGEITRRFLKEIARLGGHPEYEPELAGRRWHPNTHAIMPADEDESTDEIAGNGVATAAVTP